MAPKQSQKGLVLILYVLNNQNKEEIECGYRKLFFIPHKNISLQVSIDYLDL